ncbi:hypothetical protein SAMN04488513_102736 [Pseudozobellia thermophila]|uniref:Uncharacterized protein n=1 Tax=Pseudozobellia thermophila TaxID=192903 RepID=A0A1M6GAE8_9FLAO|nr:hypothetical protein SAMN04488513_102736 [Pseudozobellia thermophila]
MDAGKLKNYLAYALGEILLIVIGILIAWKINDLNEIRKNKIVELKIYDSLYEELNLNLVTLNSSIEHYSDDIERLEATINYVGLAPDEITLGAKDTIALLNFKEVNLLDGALNSVISTTKLEMIESDSLKKLITNYPTELGEFEMEVAEIKEIVDNNIKPVLEEHLSLSDILPKDDPKYYTIKNFGAESNYYKLLQDKEYQNSVISRLIHTEKLLTLAKKLRSRTQVIAIKLSHELGYPVNS